MKKILNGILIGGSYVIPGVCSATTAINLGEYNNLLEVTSSFYKLSVLKKHWLLILSIIFGGLSCLFLFSYLFKYIPFVLMSIFLGINIGTYKQKVNLKYLIFIILGIGFVLILSFNYGWEFEYNNSLMIFYGLIVALGFILPGLSGSLLMVNFGIYEDILNGIFNINLSLIKSLIYFGLGLLIGIIIWSKVFYKAIKNNKQSFVNFINGMVIASIGLLSYYTFDNTNNIIEIIISITIVIIFIIILRKKHNNKDEESYE